MATPIDKMKDSKKLTFRKYKDGEHQWDTFQEQIFTADETDKCPTYVHKTPPCQASCPSGEDIRGWLNIARGIEKPPKDVKWQEYAFTRATDANPFPSMMGRVCPAPCQTGCNRNSVEDYVGINAVEQYIGDYGLQSKLTFKAADQETGKKVAIIGGGVSGLSAAYQLRRNSSYSITPAVSAGWAAEMHSCELFAIYTRASVHLSMLCCYQANDESCKWRRTLQSSKLQAATFF